MGRKNPISEINKRVNHFIQQDLPRIAGKMAVDEFRENFYREGFRNNGITKWPDVKRRDKSSPWYGFQYKGEKRTSVAIREDKKTGKYVRSKKQPKLNFSQAATQRRILNGPGTNLANSIRVREASPGKVVIGTDLPYAEVHNEGGYIRIFGKKKVKIPRRQFIGESRELMDELEQKLLENVDRIVDSVTDTSDH
ncbi:phage virion morphogenesis protein [uncultured Bacteroides sp.]|uniref:phage virion morphogenesis protein n=1 Tax=uncultured Bacteroides sp. TaxID=162156 RepID=UPI00260CBD07|nr:phage virion morphogenesis protein [uncultured Bacteroides sp.]